VSISAGKGSWRAVRVEEAGFPSRIVNALVTDHRDAKCAPDDWGPLATMGDVADLTDSLLLGRPGIGRKSFKTVRAWIDNRLTEHPDGQEALTALTLLTLPPVVSDTT